MISLLIAVSVLLAAAPVQAGPCDIYRAAGTPCVAAHSVVRALYDNYNGPLYQVNRSVAGGQLMDIGVLTPGGVANAAAQDAFCAGVQCVIQRIYDQSERHNHLDVAPPGGAHRERDAPVNATKLSVSVSGKKVYAAYFEGGMGYRNDQTNGVATGNSAETLYMVTSGQHYNGGCCFDYGNAETNNLDDGAGTMEAVYWGNCGVWGRGAGNGPWVMADLENGLWAGDQKVNLNNTPIATPFVTAMVKGGENGFALKAGDATQGRLRVMYDGPRPHGYQPMKKQGAIILGIGGDNSDGAIGTFFEGVMTAGYSTDAADDAVQANIIQARYSLH
eukprot:m.242294 g.242294  ORF g.242294 m.242294 type:complete len:332 (+) comp14004_c0_seq1:3-998(+)